MGRLVEAERVVCNLWGEINVESSMQEILSVTENNPKTTWLDILAEPHKKGLTSLMRLYRNLCFFAFICIHAICFSCLSISVSEAYLFIFFFIWLSIFLLIHFFFVLNVNIGSSTLIFFSIQGSLIFNRVWYHFLHIKWSSARTGHNWMDIEW